MEKLKFNSQASLNRRLAELSEDVVWASVFFRLYQDIQTEARKGYGQYMNHSAAFWSLAVQGLLEAAVLRTCRVYDDRKGVISLPALLRVMKREEQALGSWVDSFDREVLSADLARVISRDRKKADAVLKQLIKHRNEVLAHRRAKGFGNSPASAVALRDVEELILRAHEILNRWSIVFGRQEYAAALPGSDDFKDVLEAIRTNVDERCREVGAEPYTLDEE